MPGGSGQTKQTHGASKRLCWPAELSEQRPRVYRGRTRPYADLEWQYGEPETFGLTSTLAPFPHIKLVTERAIPQDLFLTYLVMQASLVALSDERPVAWQVQRRIAELLSMVNPQ